ncbi:MAG TPA: hypothetical protein VG452_02065 [Egibacteraceae bacterium]|nr:hypothetical protein [Egibacteraceae bacterium]
MNPLDPRSRAGYWEGPARWINTVLLVVVGFIGLDTLFRLLQAREANAIVGFVRAVAGWFLAPFRGMFAGQDYLLTALMAVLGYCLLAAIFLAVVRSIEASRREHRRGLDPRDEPTRRL